MASWTIIDAETDEEVGSVNGGSGFYEYDGDEFDVQAIVDRLYSSDDDSFADDFNSAARGRYVAVSDGGDDGGDDYGDSDYEAEAAGDSPEDDPDTDLNEAESGWVATITEAQSGKRLGQVSGSQGGRVEFDITSAAFQARMLLDVVPALEAVAMLPTNPAYRESFQKVVEGLDEGKYRVGFREVLNVREAMEGLGYRGAGDTPNAVVRWGSSSPDWGGPAAPWSPVPLEPARKFIKENPDAAIEVNFPTVFEEDRSAKIGDLIKGDLAGFISHRRAAEQYAKEMGFEQFDYDDEQTEIGAEHPKDSVAPDMKPTAGKGGGEPGGAGGGVVKASPLQQPQSDSPGAGRTRAVWAGDDAAGRHSFRGEQKTLSEEDDLEEE